MQKDVVFLLRIVELVTLRPVVGHGVRKQVAFSREAASRDRLLHLLRCLQFGSRIFVPETEPAVRANGCQRAMVRVEGNVVNSENVLRTARFV